MADAAILDFNDGPTKKIIKFKKIKVEIFRFFRISNFGPSLLGFIY